MNEYQDILASQLAMNPGTWERLQSHGVTEESELKLQFMFYCPAETQARKLEAVLHEYEYKTQVRKSGGLFRRKWVLEGHTCPTTLSLEILDDWVQWMVAAGMKHNCKFDGWGASI